ncbi:hypothetical protein EIL87_09045 [Saccharopolyspora rhizosphaerae]|uniref:PLL-like beta propeller domain-containing protein n=1 Tax=Saccharopolyspora rhizosphaerae TaxID=2492662 RepID=A0A3R8QD83_9PSEU|nr:hypothetical protein [Saccharopolyspora rhizosphaerae]RRO18361.1 hypothetical protein EIL87_09045 [Saccharopolyspora rhizosphaerae]
MANWRLAGSLETLRAQFDAAFPQRNKASDGTIGDGSHQSRDSDHNPWYGPGIVTAMDITHDPQNGVDIDRITDELAASRDPRIKYVIANGLIMDSRPGQSPWQWTKYHGSNPHTQHFHISVMDSPACDDRRPWNLPSLTGAAQQAPPPPPSPQPQPSQGQPPQPPQGQPPQPQPPQGQPPQAAPPWPFGNMPWDPEVCKTIFRVGRDMRVSPKVMLSAFETGLVETQMRNLNHGDRDSVGVFQQRPSQGWGSVEQCMDVRHASQEYFERAVVVDREDPQYNAGQVAADVQRPQRDLRGKYHEREGDATKLLDWTSRAVAAEEAPPAPVPPPPGPPQPPQQGQPPQPPAPAPPGQGQPPAPPQQPSAPPQPPHQGRPPAPPQQPPAPTPPPAPEPVVPTVYGTGILPGRDGALSAFATSTSGEVVTAWQVAPGGDWVGWLGIGGEPAGRPVVVREPSGGMAVFVRDRNGEVITSSCPQHGAKWGPWIGLRGQIAEDPVAVLRPDGALALFAVGKDGTLHTAAQAGRGGHWTDWDDHGGDLVGRPAVALGRGGTVSVFARNAQREVVMSTHGTAGAGWSEWKSLGGSMAGDPVVVTLANGVTVLFAVGDDEQLYSLERPEDGGAWSGLGGDFAGTPAIGLTPDGRLEVFVRDTTGSIHTAEQQSAHGGWTAWTDLGGELAGDPVAISRPDGACTLFAVGHDGDMVTATRPEPGAPWEPWTDLVDSLKA